jgi:PTH1 family peptidyl-tRNA hydrolase
MRFIVGLGNPGPEYVWTPHNLGFLAVDRLAERLGIKVTRPEAKSHMGRGEFAGGQLVLAKPQTMMNLSGVAVQMLLDRNEGKPADLIVLVDDVDLPWGSLRIRERGSAGTHNGLKSVTRSIGTDQFVRVRMGIAPERIWGDLKDYVLSNMGRAERDSALRMAEEAAEAVEVILTEGADAAMTRFNRRVPPEQ